MKRTLFAFATGSGLFVGAIFAGAIILAGCDDRSKSTSVPTDQPNAANVAPSTQPAELASALTEPQTAPAATQPAATPHSTFSVADGILPRPIEYDFPVARLHIDRDQKTAVLYSDDPKTAINRDYAGNSYYFKIPLTDEALEHLDGYQWHFKSSSDEHQDDADGLFLQGQKYHIQPSEMVIAFQGEGAALRVGLDGNFLKFDMSRSPHEGQMVRVQGVVNATVDTAK